MKKKVFRAVIVIIILTAMIIPSIYAATEASLYLSSYDAYITKSGNTVYVNFEVEDTRIMDYVGVTEIYLYERTSSSGSWTLVKTYLYTDPNYASTMMGSNTSFKADSVSSSGNSSYQYMAYVICYAEKDGGSDSRTIFA